jgi:hypothetical protein
VARATETVDIRVGGNVQLANVSKEVDIALFPLNAIPLSIGPVPVVLTPILNVSVGLDGTAHVGFVTGVTQQASVAAGVEYLDGRWNPIHTFENSFEYIPPAVTGSLQVEAYGSVELAVLIYGVGGPYANLNAYFGLLADLQRTPPWQLYGGLRCNVGVSAQILGYSLGNYRGTVLNTKAPIAAGEAPVTKPPSPTATVTASSTSTTDARPADAVYTAAAVCDFEPGRVRRAVADYRGMAAAHPVATFKMPSRRSTGACCGVTTRSPSGGFRRDRWTALPPPHLAGGDPVYPCSYSPPARPPWRGGVVRARWCVERRHRLALSRAGPGGPVHFRWHGLPRQCRYSEPPGVRLFRSYKPLRACWLLSRSERLRKRGRYSVFRGIDLICIATMLGTAVSVPARSMAGLAVTS